jgi:hypothetical protein
MTEPNSRLTGLNKSLAILAAVVFIAAVLLLFLGPKIKTWYYLENGYPIGKYYCSYLEYNLGWTGGELELLPDGTSTFSMQGHSSTGWWTYDPSSHTLAITNLDTFADAAQSGFQKLNHDAQETGVRCSRLDQ